jgi:hypothetical protein
VGSVVARNPREAQPAQRVLPTRGSNDGFTVSPDDEIHLIGPITQIGWLVEQVCLLRVGRVRSFIVICLKLVMDVVVASSGCSTERKGMTDKALTS